MIRKVRKIILLTLMMLISYNHVCYADVISPREMLSPLSLLSALFCLVILLIYASSFFMFKKIMQLKTKKETLVVDEKNGMFEEKTNADWEEKHEKKLYFWLSATLILLMYFFTLQFFIPFFVLLFFVIILLISKIVRKIGNKVLSKKIYFIAVLIMVCTATYITVFTLHNIQFTKYTFYPGPRSMGQVTEDVDGLIDAVIKNNERPISLKVNFCVKKRAKLSFSEIMNEEPPKEYRTKEDLEQLKEILNSDHYDVYIEYDRLHNFILAITVYGY